MGIKTLKNKKQKQHCFKGIHRHLSNNKKEMLKVNSFWFQSINTQLFEQKKNCIPWDYTPNDCVGTVPARKDTEQSRNPVLNPALTKSHGLFRP